MPGTLMAPGANSSHVEGLRMEARCFFFGVKKRFSLLIGGLNRGLGLTHELAGLGFAICRDITQGGIQ
jgi:hypothetical protein